MHRILRHLAIASLAAGLVGCSDFLSGPSVDVDPNNPNATKASPDNLFGALQAGQFTSYAGSELAITICGYVQQCKGINGRHVETQLVEYNTSPLTFATNWDQIYRNGGLRDLRLIQQQLEARPTRDPLYEGIIKVWEALIISEAADKWGDIPYSEAAKADLSTPGTPPPLDDQLAVYDRTVAVLDTAIGLIQDPAGIGPGAVDFGYGGVASRWLALAHTLKARILLHTSRHPQRCGTTLNGCALFTQIRDEALQGIPQGGRDFKVVVSGTDAQQQNGWYQFYGYSGFDDDLRVGDFFINLLTTRGDSRDSTYIWDPGDGDYFPRQVYAFGDADPAFQVPWVTADENTGLLAEAYFRIAGGPNANSDAQVNVLRAKGGLGALANATIPQIIEEKYMTLFLNPELWNDWKRTGCPAITSTSTQSLGPEGAAIPRRVYYGQQEQDLNPNIPNASLQTGSGGPNLPDFRNDNDPTPDPVCS